MNNLKKNKNNDPTFKVVEDIVVKYNLNKESAWSLYRPIFWYLTEQKIIGFKNSCWYLSPEYQNPSQNMVNKLVDAVLHSYRGTLSARVEKYCDSQME